MWGCWKQNRKTNPLVLLTGEQPAASPHAQGSASTVARVWEFQHVFSRAHPPSCPAAARRERSQRNFLWAARGVSSHAMGCLAGGVLFWMGWTLLHWWRGRCCWENITGSLQSPCWGSGRAPAAALPMQHELLLLPSPPLMSPITQFSILRG